MLEETEVETKTAEQSREAAINNQHTDKKYMIYILTRLTI